MGQTRWRSYAALGPDSALGPALALASGKNAKAATLLLLYTPPRVVSSPGRPTEGQGRAVEHVKMRQNAVTATYVLKRRRYARELAPTGPLVGQLLPHAYAWGQARYLRGGRKKGPTAQENAQANGHGGIYPHRLQRCGWPKHGPWPEAWPLARALVSKRRSRGTSRWVPSGEADSGATSTTRAPGYGIICNAALGPTRPTARC
jgi:hypothetical protein